MSQFSGTLYLLTTFGVQTLGGTSIISMLPECPLEGCEEMDEMVADTKGMFEARVCQFSGGVVASPEVLTWSSSPSRVGWEGLTKSELENCAEAGKPVAASPN